MQKPDEKIYKKIQKCFRNIQYRTGTGTSFVKPGRVHIFTNKTTIRVNGLSIFF